ncbi:glycosyltransferase [Pseudomonas sp. CNPSo 3701]|uniref:glycosyltransferase n=1 Tax=Pseudomonas sp. CNPSo 3701 TaxID=3027943 RepID=UPI002363CE0D|nr:glycosyltransferase [Pseudomonas sp. CNPSo 3701]MDD1508257.1 glycosyltransferase [Pseudomonas sp. CNPSo 3701]
MKKYKLAVVIPTIDRVKYLKGVVNELLPLLVDDIIELCISANKCSDTTHSFLKSLEDEEYCGLKVKYHDALLTIDQNMLCAIGLSDAEYIFPLGDDDFISRESVLAILELVSRSRYDLILLNGFHADDGLRVVRGHLPSELLGRSFDCPAAAFSHVWSFMPFGSFVFFAENFNFDFSARYMGTSHAYTGVIWDSLARKCEQGFKVSVFCMPDKTVLLRGAEKTWASSKTLILYHEIPLWFNLVLSNKIYWNVASQCLSLYQRRITSFKFVFSIYCYSNDYLLLRTLPLLDVCFIDRLFLRVLFFVPRGWLFKLSNLLKNKKV